MNDELERQKFEYERDIKQKELDLKEKEFQLKKKDSFYARLFNSTTGALIAFLTAGIVAYINMQATIATERERSQNSKQIETQRFQAQLELEKKKQEGVNIQEALRFASPEQASRKAIAARLLQFAEFDLITLTKNQRDKYILEAGDSIPSLPVAGVGAAQAQDFSYPTADGRDRFRDEALALIQRMPEPGIQSMRGGIGWLGDYRATARVHPEIDAIVDPVIGSWLDAHQAANSGRHRAADGLPPFDDGHPGPDLKSLADAKEEAIRKLKALGPHPIK